jgi:toxin ParE1/3/4
MAEYRLSPKAQRDLDGVFDYTATQWGLSQALRYTDLIETGCASLAESPLHSQNCTTIRPGYRRRNVEQHVIYFRQTSYGIAVIRILHQRMDAPRHL